MGCGAHHRNHTHAYLEPVLSEQGFCSPPHAGPLPVSRHSAELLSSLAELFSRLIIAKGPLGRHVLAARLVEFGARLALKSRRDNRVEELSPEVRQRCFLHVRG